MSLLLNVESVTNDGGGDDIMKMFLGALTNEDGLPSHHIRNQFMLFTLQGLKNDVTNKLQVSHALHMQGMHCMAH